MWGTEGGTQDLPRDPDGNPQQDPGDHTGHRPHGISEEAYGGLEFIAPLNPVGCRRHVDGEYPAQKHGAYPYQGLRQQAVNRYLLLLMRNHP
jgi:hypothetical protein